MRGKGFRHLLHDGVELFDGPHCAETSLILGTFDSVGSQICLDILQLRNYTAYSQCSLTEWAFHFEVACDACRCIRQ